MLYIGTSGWNYPHWREIFYPKELSPKNYLAFFSKHFKTVEVNYSFYRLPSVSTYEKWRRETPENFIFSLKASRFITHIKRLNSVEKPFKEFLKRAENLKEKLGPILFQFPANFQASGENVKRLKKFTRETCGKYRLNQRLKCAFEFRHKSWAEKKIYNLLEDSNSAWVIADSPSYPKVEKITADFIYIRMHGSKVLFGSNYSQEELKDLANKIKKWRRKTKNIYIYFNNDAYGYAVQNAKFLSKLLKE